MKTESILSALCDTVESILSALCVIFGFIAHLTLASVMLGLASLAIYGAFFATK